MKKKGMKQDQTMNTEKNRLFEIMCPAKALAVMALPTIASQMIILLYNLADTWFIGRTGNPYMIGASSLALTVYLAATALANVFGVGGGSLMVRLIGEKKTEDARKVASYSVAVAAVSALVFSLLVLILMEPLLRLLGASGNTMVYAKQYVLATTVLGGIPTVLSMCMPQLLRNAGYSKEAGIGVGLGSLLNVALDPLFMFVLLFWLFARPIVGAFIADEATILQGAAFLRGRCFALPFMMIGYHIVNYMNAVNQGKVSFLLALIRHIALIIPILLVMNRAWGLNGLIWSQLAADALNALIASVIFFRVNKQI